MTDTEDKDKQLKEEEGDKNPYLAYGISFGLLGGTIVASLAGPLFNTPLVWAFGPGFGMLIGIVIASVMDANKDKE